MASGAKVGRACCRQGVNVSLSVGCLGHIRKLLLLLLFIVLIQTGCSQPPVETVIVGVTTTRSLSTQDATSTTKRLPTSTKTQKPQTSLNACVATGAVNVRSGPGTEFSIIGGLINSDCIRVDARSSDGVWIRTTSRDWRMAVHGWVASKYFDIDGDVGILPVSTPDPTPTATRYRPSPTITRWPTATEGPTKPPPPVGSGTCSCSGNIYNCPDFSTQAKAQACYNYCKSLGYGDIHRLDRDKDGIACEWNP